MGAYEQVGLQGHHPPRPSYAIYRIFSQEAPETAGWIHCPRTTPCEVEKPWRPCAVRGPVGDPVPPSRGRSSLREPQLCALPSEAHRISLQSSSYINMCHWIWKDFKGRNGKESYGGLRLLGDMRVRGFAPYEVLPRLYLPRSSKPWMNST